MNRDFFNDFQASLFAICVKKVNDWKTVGLSSNIQTFKWDAHVDQTELPPSDLLGLMDLTVTSDHEMLKSAVMFTISTLQDVNNDRMDKMVGDLFMDFQAGTYYPLLRASDGSVYSKFTVMNGTQVMPVMSTDVRAARSISVSLAAESVRVP